MLELFNRTFRRSHTAAPTSSSFSSLGVAVAVSLHRAITRNQVTRSTNTARGLLISGALPLRQGCRWVSSFTVERLGLAVIRAYDLGLLAVSLEAGRTEQRQKSGGGLGQRG